MRYFDFRQHWNQFLEMWYSINIQSQLEGLLRLHGFLHDDKWRPFLPLSKLTGRDEVDGSVASIILPHGCHVYAPCLFQIAIDLCPKSLWTLVEGDRHSTVVCIPENIMFDLLCWHYYQSSPRKALTAIEVYEMSLGVRKGPLCNTLTTLKLDSKTYADIVTTEPQSHRSRREAWN